MASAVGIPSALAVVRPARPLPWDEALAMQRAAHAARVAGTGPDTLFLVEHGPVVTLGPRTAPGDLLVPEAILRSRGVDVRATDRGGGITWHGPGQVVGYPILSLRAWGLGPRDYLRFLEDLLAGVLRGFGVEASVVEGRTGLWVAGAKVCAMGIRVDRGVSLHGFALNVEAGAADFAPVVPCGIADAGVTGLRQLLGSDCPSLDAVMDAVGRAFLAADAARRAAA